MTDDEWGVDEVTGMAITKAIYPEIEYFVIDEPLNRRGGLICTRPTRALAMRAIMAMGIRTTARIQKVG